MTAVLAIDASARTITAAIRAREISALEVIESTLQHVERTDPVVNAFTAVTRARARESAARIDRMLDRADPAADRMPLREWGRCHDLY